MRVLIIGAGIGGLTAAAALHRTGAHITVLERTPALTPAGTAISLAPNALRALDTLGVGDRIRDLAAWQGDGGLRTPGGRWLSRSDARSAETRFGGPLVLLPRTTLVDTLAALLPPDAIRTNTPATLTDPGDATRPAQVTTPQGELEADLVVAADGVHSSVRRALFPDQPGVEYAGFTTWRLLLPLPGVEFTSHETWGRGRLWGSHPLKDGRVYAYAAARAPKGQRANDERAELQRQFGDWHAPVPQLLAAARPQDVLRHDVHQIAVPLPAFHRGRVALLGDAAHAMPPTLGQGGNQAIEDAVVLAHTRDDLHAYTAARLPRTTAVARRAVRAGRLGMLRGRGTTAVRNAAMTALSAAGPALFLRGFDGIADWRPPYAAQQTTR
ncbi:FAD-dependent monooxygenase [Streptomyces roseirectus]|uniref:FAD-dependent monooxygenase n=1 Tax=Streptomyces roseirectus TaxID=2768066 RepID=A0A7H0IME7_9ACTN|nr:FAD-dependent monooxygenase [Streptomyces roseirectus]QNP73963.1 FAD-dependent monooxygenase [Streptomyces roseirectus]